MKLYTHLNIDLDAAASVWAAQEFMPGAADAVVTFVPANWDGNGFEDGDIAVDLNAGGHGVKGLQLPSGAVMSAFDSIMLEHAPIAAQQALAHLRRFVDVQDSTGSVVKTLLPEAPRELQEMFAATGINAVLRALQATYKGMDTPVLAVMSSIFEGMLIAGMARQRAAIEAETAEIIQKPGAKVAIVRNGKEYGTNGVLYDDHGVDAVVYVDGTNLGITRKGDCQIPMDHPKIRVVVEAAQEASEWFAHPAKYLYCRGSRKAPAETPSKVDPRQLAEAVLSAFPDPE